MSAKTVTVSLDDLEALTDWAVGILDKDQPEGALHQLILDACRARGPRAEDKEAS